MAQNNASTSLSRTNETAPARRGERALRSPWEDLADMHRQMDDFFSRAFGFTPLSRLIPSESMEIPDLDVYEQNDKIMVEAPVPGFSKNEIKLEATPDSIHIEGERSSEQRDETRRHRRSHWSGFTRFQADIPLPAEIDPNRVEAKLEHGVLKLELPKSELARQKSVQVNVKGP